MKAVAILTAAIGVSVCGFGLTQLVAALAAAPGDAVIAALDNGDFVSAAALERALESRRSALEWSNAPRYHRDLARAARILGRRFGDDPAAAIAAFELSARTTEDGLRLAPIDPASWLRLAVIRLDVDAAPQSARTALRAAVTAVPYDPVRTESRVRLVLQLSPALDAADRVLFQQQFRHLWNDDPDALVRLASSNRVYVIALAMLDDAEAAEILKLRRDDLLQSRP